MIFRPYQSWKSTTDPIKASAFTSPVFVTPPVDPDYLDPRSTEAYTWLRTHAANGRAFPRPHVNHDDPDREHENGRLPPVPEKFKELLDYMTNQEHCRERLLDEKHTDPHFAARKLGDLLGVARRLYLQLVELT